MRTTCLRILWVLALLVLVKAALLVWPFVSSHAEALKSFLDALGGLKPPLTGFMLSASLLLTCAITIAVAALGALAWGLSRAQGARGPGLAPSIVLCALLIVLLLLGSLFSLAIRSTLMDL